MKKDGTVEIHPFSRFAFIRVHLRLLLLHSLRLLGGSLATGQFVPKTELPRNRIR
jgi:hypothetical protein